MGLNRTAVVLVSLLLSATCGADPRPFTVNTGFTPPVSTIFEKIVGEAFRRLSIEVDFQEVSAERSLILVNEGTDDAECCRIPQVVLKQYKDLVTVPESVFEVRFSAFATSPDVTIETWGDLKPYSVGTVTGWKILVNNIQRIAPREYYELSDPAAMFRMLDKGRLEVATLGHLSGIKVVDELGLQDIVRPLQPPLAARELYLMLNKRHADLVPQLTRTLQAMKADGTIDGFIRQVIAGQ